MKADGVGTRNIDDTIGQTHWQTIVKNSKAKSVSQNVNKGAHGLITSIEQTDQIAEDVIAKLEEMSRLLNRTRNEKDDIIREQLIRFFNVLKVYINEALHPTGDWSTDQIMSGKSIKVDLGADGTSIVVQGERIDNMEIRELSKSPTSEDLETMQQNIKDAQAIAKKLRNNIASARSQIIHHSNKSSEITL
jgi:hypothetical protein